jgi:hypothetical protein
MLYATNRFPGDGMTTQYEISFTGGYLDRAHVKAYVEGADLVQTPVTLSPGNFLGPYTIGGLAPIPVGSTLVIYRDTPKAPLVDFVNGSRFTEANLDTATRQGSFIAAEGADAVSPTGLEGFINQLEGFSSAAGVARDQAVLYSDLAVLSADQAATNAALAGDSANYAGGAAAQALNSSLLADTYAANASLSADNAAISKTGADIARDYAVIAKNAAEAALESFDDRYLGAKAVAPTTDNDGGALLVGALYWDTSLPGMRSWNGGAWVTLPAATAAAISNTPSGSITATTVQGAINELAEIKVDLAAPSGASLSGFQQSGAGAVARTSEEKMRDRVHVKDFGAATSATAAENLVAIQDALNAGKHIDFGSAADSYSINGTLTLASGHMLNLCGATITQTVDQTPIFNASGTDNVTIKGGRFVGKSEATFTNTPSSQAICIKADNATDLVVTENRFENFYYSPLMINAGGNRVEFSKNVVKGPGSAVLGVDINLRNCTGATITGANLRIHGNDIYDTAQGLIIGQGSSNITITGNIIHDLINEHGIYADTGLKGLTITGNTIRYTGSAGVGIKVQHYDAFGVMPENIVISGNSISYTGSDGILINNTTVDGALFASGVVIANNVIYQAGQYGIDVRFTRGGTVTGNSIEQTVLSSIFIAKCSVLAVTGNSIRVTGEHGIYDAGTSSDVSIVSNIINDVGSSAESPHCGILITVCSEHVIQGNIVRGVPARMGYGLFITTGPLTTTEVRGNSFTGALNTGARFAADAGMLRYFGENKLAGSGGENLGHNVPETLQRGTEENTYFGTSAPTSGTWAQGVKVINRYPAAGGHMGWVCVVGGTPGTWKTFGPVTA